MFIPEVSEACITGQELPLDDPLRSQVAGCLGWQKDGNLAICHGFYVPLNITPLPDAGLIHIDAQETSLSPHGQSILRGKVHVRNTDQVISAETAYIYRDSKTGKISKIDLQGNVYLMEGDKLIIARRLILHPQTKAGEINDVLYRLQVNHAHALQPAWGRAKEARRLPNKDLWFNRVTYTTCPPYDRAWQLSARDIKLYHADSKAVAKDAVLRVHDIPILYTPYLSFPTEKKRKTGFLMPIIGYSNISGLDVAEPFYWNMAPNYDATIIPHYYSDRGLMLGTDFRFLTQHSTGVLSGKFLPNDRAYQRFLNDEGLYVPSFLGRNNNRWSYLIREDSQFGPQLHLNIDAEQVSDPYYLQNFSSNLALATENQLRRQGTLTYRTNHWNLTGMVQSYQTLHPINQSTISDIYARLPELTAYGFYAGLPYNAELNILSSLDVFSWPGNIPQAQGPRYHLNPILSFLWEAPWGFVIPHFELVENYYTLDNVPLQKNFNRTIPRYNLDMGLTFERFLTQNMQQTLEPRLFYLYVPYQDQTPIPVFDSAYMIFNYDELFRYNRFSGSDRIGDTNQLSYAVTSRFLESSGLERASVSVGQMRFFARRRVQLCYNPLGECFDDPLALGFLSPNTTYSPVATRATVALQDNWRISGDYMFDAKPRSTYSADVNLHYMPADNKIINFGYTYLAFGNTTAMLTSGVHDAALHQATVAATWPLWENWSIFGIYSYNISKQYDMLTFAGIQFDDCCWAFRAMGGRNFMSLDPVTLAPQYNTNFYVQILLKGLGAVARNDPASIIQTYLPGYSDIFH